MPSFAHTITKIKDPDSYNSVVGGCESGRFSEHKGACKRRAEYECHYKFYRQSRGKAYMKRIALCPAHAVEYGHRFDCELPGERPPPMMTAVAGARRAKKEKRVPVRFSHEEHSLLAVEAVSQGRDLAPYLRWLIFTHPARAKKGP